MTLSASEAIAFLQTLCQMPDAVASKASWIAIAQAAGLPAGDFIEGDPSERWLEIGGRAMGAWGTVPSQAARAFFFALCTDPGDVDDFGVPDQSAVQTPRPGFLSAFGAGWWGTERGGETRATSFVTIQNTGLTPTSPFAAGDLTFEYSTATRDDGGTPTYVNTADPSIYTGIGDTLTLAPSASVTIPVQAQQLGEYGSAAANLIDTCVTQSFGTLTVTASTTAIGETREPRPDYIARCLVAADGNAPGGPGNAYRRAMNTRRDGKVLQRFDGSGPVTITMAYVSPDSALGTVTVYFGGPAGAVDDIDVSSANANIVGTQLLDPVTGEDHNPDPIGVLPDCVTIGPATSDPNTGGPGGESCTNDLVDVTFSVKIRASKVPGGATPGTYTSGGSPPAPVAALGTRANEALSLYLLSTGIGGLDQVSGAGVVYTADLPGVIRDAVPGFYDPVVTTPSSPTTAVALGHIATLGTLVWTIVVTAG